MNQLCGSFWYAGRLAAWLFAQSYQLRGSTRFAQWTLAADQTATELQLQLPFCSTGVLLEFNVRLTCKQAQKRLCQLAFVQNFLLLTDSRSLAQPKTKIKRMLEAHQSQLLCS